MTNLFREIAREIGFTEGPLWLSDGRLLVTSMSRGTVFVLDVSAAPDSSVHSRIETGGGPNGLAADRSGAIYVAQNPTFRTRSTRPVRAGLQRIDGADVVDLPLPDSVAPNDLVAGPDGAIWFTDPASSDALPPRIRRWLPGDTHATTVAEAPQFPNGLAFSADGAWLYVADSHAHEIVRFARNGARLGPSELVAVVSGSEPDGIAFDREGYLYIAAFGLDAVVILAPDGTEAGRLDTGAGSKPTNLCFAGAELDTLVVTLASGGRVVATTVERAGLAL